MNPLRIAHFESSMDWGGQELRIIEQTEWLNQNGHFAMIIARPASKIIQQAEQRNIPCATINLRGTVHPFVLAKLWRIVRKNRIDILDCHGSRDAAYGALLKWLTKLAVVRSRHVTNEIKSHGWYGLVWRHGQHAVTVTADKIRKQLLEKHLAFDQDIFVVPAGVDPQRFRPDIDDRALRQSLGIAPEAVVIANIGMIRPDKGQLYFVHAARSLLDSFDNLVFIQVGEATGQTEAYREQVIAEAGDEFGKRILFLGYHDDIEQYLALANIVVIASIATEAQTRLVPQAALMKRNIIATRVGGLPEMIDDCETGLLCAPQDHDAIAVAVKTLLTQPQLAAELRDNAYQKARQTMTFDVMMATVLTAYHAALYKAKG
jgi:Glycosyltransferase